ncbi:sensor histidine kinase [Streptacidiphilus sp. EB129]|uniref:sensor histidine kinase n=1 Tax=Streptacidiphilus sp. EB129 TaxID=3156262 RepID=UPI003518556C
MAATALRRLAASLWGRQVRLRWVHLILGGALAMPFLMLTLVVAGIATRGRATATLPVALLSFLAALPIAAAVAAAVPAVRVIEGNAARVLLGGPFARLRTGRATAPGARARSAAWFALHLGIGGLLSGLTLAGIPFAAVELAAPLLTPASRSTLDFVRDIPAGLGPVTALALVAAVLLGGAGSGGLLARCAPRLLGPSPAETQADELAERLAAAEDEAARLGERNRIARELHDSVGHALSVVTLQAGAAARVLDRDPEFVRRALEAMEQSARGALEELDQVLGVLREGIGGASRAPLPDLTRLPELLAAARAAGTDVRAEPLPDADRVAALPGAVSRAAYRILQEGLTNALRHGGPGPVELRLRLADGEGGLELWMSNTLAAVRRPGRSSGGNGLPGMSERAAALGGTAGAGPDGEGRWLLAVRLPLPPGTGRAP